MKQLILSLATLALVSGASVAQAQRGGDRPQGQIRLNLDLNDQEFNGQNQTLRLRQLINQQNPNIQLNRYDLQSLIVIAKSRAGNGQVALLIDGRQVDKAGVPGRPAEYDRNQGSTFSNVQLRAQGRTSEGNWVLNIDGNVKIRRITAVLREERGPRPPGPGPGTQVVDVAQGRFQKILPDANNHQVRVDHVQELRLTTVDGAIHFREIQVTFANGANRLYPLNATALRGQTVRVPLEGRDVRALRVMGTSIDLIGSRSSYKIEALVQRR